MPDTTLQAIKSANADLVRKILDAAVVVAPMSAAVPTSFTSTTSAALQSLPTDYQAAGFVQKDQGYSWTRETEMSEVTAHGSVEPIRRDINSDTSGFSMTMLESSRLALELFHNVDLSAVTPTATTGELGFSRAAQPSTTYRRVIAIGQDGVGADAIYLIRILPRAMVSEVGEQAWSDTDGLVYPITFSATVDPVLGYSFREVWAGPGWKSRLEAAGFPAAA